MKINDKVKFVRTGSDIMDDKTGTILGKYGQDVYASYYIVMLDEKLADRDDLAVVITEHCLEVI